MTISSDIRKAGPYSANGATVTFPFSFKCFSTADVQVVLTNASDVETVLTLTSQYTVALNADQNTSPGGSITTVATYASGNKITIVGDVDYQQNTDITNGGGFYPEVIENALDKVTMQVQQIKEQVDRSAKLPVSSTEDADALVADLVRLADSAANIDTVAGSIANVNTVAGIASNVTAVAGVAADVTTVAAVAADVPAVANVAADIPTVAANVADITNFADVYQGAKAADPTTRNDLSPLQAGDLYFNTTASEMRVYAGSQWVDGTAGTMSVQRFSGNGATAAFTLSFAPSSENNTQIYISGVYQQKDTYSVSGTTLTFSAAPPSGTDNIEVVIISTLSIGETDASLVAFTNAGNGSINTNVEDALQSIPGDLGDYNVDNNLLIFCGDSTTEQMQASGYAFDRMTIRRSVGEKWEKVLGTINFGGSGYTANGFVNDAVGTIPTISTSNLGINNWDYYGHKPIGAISLATAMAWRSGKADRVTWVICYGINDCILYASVGNLSQADITNYILERLNKAITTLRVNYPQDKIVLRVPNPMTARPYNAGAGFPSPTQYPSFGTDLAADQALVEKWNHALRNAYLAVQNNHTGTILFDTWLKVFGQSNTTLTAGTQLPYLGDLVHPSGSGYVALAEALVTSLSGRFSGSSTRRQEADARAALLANNAWENYAGYFRDNPYFKLVAGEGEKYGLVAIGSNYIDIGVTLTQFQQQVDVSKPIYISIGDRAAQRFASYNITAIGNSIRLFSITVSAAMQAAAAGSTVFIYQENGVQLVSNDVYVNSTVITQKEYFAGGVVSGGAGYFDFSISGERGRISSKFKDGVINGSIAVGGGVNTNLALSTASSVVMNGTPSQRVIRVLISGDYSSWAGKAAALYFSDDVPSPKSYEDLSISGTTSGTPGTETSHAHGLGYTPKRTYIMPTSNGVIYQSKAPDSTNIYVKGSAASLTFNAYVK